MIHDNVVYEVTDNGFTTEMLGSFLKAIMRDGVYPDSYKEAEVK